jgi:hypothetical protein
MSWVKGSTKNIPEEAMLDRQRNHFWMWQLMSEGYPALLEVYGEYY